MINVENVSSHGELPLKSPCCHRDTVKGTGPLTMQSFSPFHGLRPVPPHSFFREKFDFSGRSLTSSSLADFHAVHFKSSIYTLWQYRLKTIAEKAKERHIVEALERVRQAVAEKRVSLMKRWPKQSEKLVS